MRRWGMLLGMLVWAGCGTGQEPGPEVEPAPVHVEGPDHVRRPPPENAIRHEVRTYLIAPYLEPGYSCVECAVSLTLRARDLGTSELSLRHFAPDAFAQAGFQFRWGVEQVIEVDEEHYDPGGLQDDPGVRYAFKRVVVTNAVEPGGRFEMRFPKEAAGRYPEDFLVRDGEQGFRIGQRTRLVCDTPEVCDALASYPLAAEGFVLELGYPATEGGPLRLHSLRALP